MPHTLNVMLIDAFTNTPLTGNPCLVVLNADELSPDTMQAIAREANLSETAFILKPDTAQIEMEARGDAKPSQDDNFVLKSDTAHFRARYFTPAEEIPLAGHPTLAVSRALLDSGQIAFADGAYNLQLQAGIVQVTLSQAGDDVLFTMAQRPPAFLRTYAPEQVAPIFGLTPADLLPDVPVQTVSTGTPQLMIPVRDQETLRRARIDHASYITLRQTGDFFSPHLFCTEGISPDAATFARHFGTPPDTQEDPFTGSATGGMAAYLWHYGLIASPHFIAEQGHWMQRPGRAFVEVVGSPLAIETVRVGGPAVRIMTGEMTI